MFCRVLSFLSCDFLLCRAFFLLCHVRFCHTEITKCAHFKLKKKQTTTSGYSYVATFGYIYCCTTETSPGVVHLPYTFLYGRQLAACTSSYGTLTIYISNSYSYCTLIVIMDQPFFKWFSISLPTKAYINFMKFVFQISFRVTRAMRASTQGPGFCRRKTRLALRHLSYTVRQRSTSQTYNHRLASSI